MWATGTAQCVNPSSVVKALVQQLFVKTGARSRAQLVRVAVERYWQELESVSEGG